VTIAIIFNLWVRPSTHAWASVVTAPLCIWPEKCYAAAEIRFLFVTWPMATGGHLIHTCISLHKSLYNLYRRRPTYYNDAMSQRICSRLHPSVRSRPTGVQSVIGLATLWWLRPMHTRTSTALVTMPVRSLQCPRCTSSCSLETHKRHSRYPSLRLVWARAWPPDISWGWCCSNIMWATHDPVCGNNCVCVCTKRAQLHGRTKFFPIYYYAFVHRIMVIKL
jgi:hypothetical protein